jgi:alpha-lactalbumin
MSKLEIAFLILTAFTAAVKSKVFTRCEYAEELIRNQNISLVEAKQHLCILRKNTDTSEVHDNYHGIYKINSQWWCGRDGVKSGGCNIACESLLDDDVSDDVICAGKILQESGTDGWGVSKASCIRFLEEFLLKCPLEKFQEKPVETAAESEEAKMPEIAASFEQHKIEPNIIFNIFTFNISGDNHKIEYRV